MGSKNKLKRFVENESFKNVVQPSRDELIEKKFKQYGSWRKQVFKNSNPIVLELGCGKGEYTVNLAKLNPNKNFIGIDIKGARFWRGAKTSLEEKLSNVYFLRTQIELLNYVFEENEIDEIWANLRNISRKYRKIVTKCMKIVHFQGLGFKG